jgi:hypothetical protein
MTTSGRKRKAEINNERDLGKEPKTEKRPFVGLLKDYAPVRKAVLPFLNTVELFQLRATCGYFGSLLENDETKVWSTNTSSDLPILRLNSPPAYWLGHPVVLSWTKFEPHWAFQSPIVPTVT